jgi:hypothetical protein
VPTASTSSNPTDQTLSLDSSLQDGQRFTGIHINDVPDFPVTPQMIDAFTRAKTMLPSAARSAALADLKKKYPPAHQRRALDRDPDNSVGLTLADASGHPRLKVTVAPDGTPAIQFLDAQGNITSTLASTGK